MTSTLTTVPFVNLKLQHQPIQTELDQAVQTVMQRGDFILGQAVTDFETHFAQASGTTYGIGVATGTDAIALGLEACGIGAGDQVLLPANTFIATLIGVVTIGATPVLVDCDPKTALMDLEAAARLITPRTKAILPVHLYGQLVPPRPLLDLAQAHNLIIFEDAAQAHLAHRDGCQAGTLGKAAAYSFYPSKNLGAFGDGGMVLTSDETVAQKVRSLRNYGSPKKYLHTEPGTNSRLDTMQAAILEVKLPHLEGWNRDRNKLAHEYDTLLLPLQEKGIIAMENQSGTGHIYHLYVIRVTDDCPLDRDTLKQKLSDLNIQTGIHYPIPCHLQPAYESLGYGVGAFPVAELLSRQILSLPMFPGLTLAQVNQVVEAIRSVLQG
ncbi:MAG: DegT/DnrJ/EryC1/StrS family aminotransferase [Microcoleaceae cyanobacterium]